MNRAIEAAFIGRLGQDPELKTSAAGKPWARLHLAVGQEPDTQWVSVAVFGEIADRLCAKLRKGDKVYVEGTLRLSEWTGRDGEKRAGLSVAAWKAEMLGAIGRNKASRSERRAGAGAADRTAGDTANAG